MARIDLKSMTIEELQDFMSELGEPKFRAKQIFEWLHKKMVNSVDDMTNISKSLRIKL